MFTGFPQAGLDFLVALGENNNKEWFAANKPTYQAELLGPALEFVETMGERLREISPAIRYDTRTNGSGSLMRIYRDVRFSKDKSPYKTAVAGMFWEGEGKKTANPGFGFQVTSAGIGLVAGMFGFDKAQLDAYRQAVDDDGLGRELEGIVAALEETGAYTVHTEHYKRTPRGFDADHPRERLLRFNSMHTYPVANINDASLHSAELVDKCYNHFVTMAPVQKWLLKAFAAKL